MITKAKKPQLTCDKKEENGPFSKVTKEDIAKTNTKIRKALDEWYYDQWQASLSIEEKQFKSERPTKIKKL